MDTLFPGPLSKKIIFRDKKTISPSYHREYPFVFERARDVWLWDADGRKYLDFAAGIAVMNVGHTNPFVVRAVSKQLRSGIHAAFPDFYAQTPVAFSEKLLSLLPSSLERVFLSNSGTESNECALKLAKYHTGKKWIIAFDHCFHGRTMGSLSMTNSKPIQRKGFGPFLPVEHVPYPYLYRSRLDEEDLVNHCTQELLRAIKKHKNDVAALFAEPIQGEGGIIVPPQRFLKNAYKICKEEGVLFCCDEVQAGCFRTGTFLASFGFGVTPDIVTMAKALSGGFPIGATISSAKIMDWPPGSHSNTFGGNLISCAAGVAALTFMKSEKLGENAKNVGNSMMALLTDMKKRHEIIGDVRGKGLMIGVEFVKNKKSKKPYPIAVHKILCKAAEEGLILLPAGESTIRISPSLTLTKEDACKGLEILERAIKNVR